MGLVAAFSTFGKGMKIASMQCHLTFFLAKADLKKVTFIGGKNNQRVTLNV